MISWTILWVATVAWCVSCWSRMPHHRATRADEAMASYEAAMEVWPGYLSAIHGAARLVLRLGRNDNPRLAGWLDEVALRGDDKWREWALGRQLAPKPSEQLEVLSDGRRQATVPHWVHRSMTP